MHIYQIFNDMPTVCYSNKGRGQEGDVAKSPGSGF